MDSWESWLWDSPVHLDEDNFSLGQELDPRFRFYREIDPVQNGAANEERCKQAMRILIKNADTEIAALEEEMVLLQSQVAWTDDEGWAETFSSALTEKIQSLEKAIERLKNEGNQQNQPEAPNQIENHEEPAEKIYKILKPLVEKYFLQKEDQDLEAFMYQLTDIIDFEAPKGNELADMVLGCMLDAEEQETNFIMKPMEEVANRDKIDPEKQLAMMVSIETRSPPGLKKNDEWLNAESLGELLNDKKEEARRPEIEETPISQIPEGIQNTEVTGPEESQSKLLLEHKNCSQLDPRGAQEPSLAVEKEPKPSPMKNLQKSMITDKHADSSSANRNFRRQAINRSPSAAPDASMTSDSQSEKKRKSSSISTDSQENKESENIQAMARRHENTAHGMVAMPRASDPALETMTRDALRRLARANKLKGYSKLRKEELLKQLKAKSQDGDWKGI